MVVACAAVVPVPAASAASGATSARPAATAATAKVLLLIAPLLGSNSSATDGPQRGRLVATPHYAWRSRRGEEEPESVAPRRLDACRDAPIRLPPGASASRACTSARATTARRSTQYSTRAWWRI